MLNIDQLVMKICRKILLNAVLNDAYVRFNFAKRAGNRAGSIVILCETGKLKLIQWE